MIPTVALELSQFALVWLGSIFCALCLTPVFLTLRMVQNIYRNVVPQNDPRRCGIVVVTGGANGIGRATVRHLCQLSVPVVAVDIDDVKLRSLQQSLPGAELTIVSADVTSSDDIRRLRHEVQSVMARLNTPLYAIVNNAGLHHTFEPAMSITEESIQKIFSVNVFAPISLVRNLYDILRKPGGRIVNIGSVGALLGAPYLGVYSASKFALQGFTETLRREARADGVDVIILHPYFVNTDAHEVLLRSDVSQLREEFTKLQLSLETLRSHFMTPEEVVPDVLDALYQTWPQDMKIVAFSLDELCVWILRHTPNWCGVQDFLVRRLQSSFVYEYMNVSSAEVTRPAHGTR